MKNPHSKIYSRSVYRPRPQAKWSADTIYVFALIFALLSLALTLTQ